MIVVTGGYGCLGSNVVRALVERGERVTALRRAEEPTSALADISADVEDAVGDVRDADAMDRLLAGRTGLYHLAGVAVMTNAAGRAMYEVNVRGTANVMRAARRHGLRVVHTSSVSAIGFPASGTIADESFAFNGSRFPNAYMRTKHAGEQAVQGEVARGLDAVILNPGGVMAPGGDGRTAWPNFAIRVARGQFPFSPPGGFSMVAGAEFREAQLAAFAKGAAGRRYIIATEYMSYSDLIRRIAQRVGARPPRGVLPAALLRAVAAAAVPVNAFIREPDRKLMLAPENLPVLTGDLHYSPRRSRDELGVGPGDMDRAIDEVVAWCRERRFI